MAWPGTINLPTTVNLNGAQDSELFYIQNEMKGTPMKSRKELHQQLRESILGLPGVTERQQAGIHEDAFFVGPTMFMHIHGHGHCDIRLSKDDQELALAEGNALPHRWAPEAGYVTAIVEEESDLEPTMELIRKSHLHFAQKHHGSAIVAA